MNPPRILRAAALVFAVLLGLSSPARSDHDHDPAAMSDEAMRAAADAWFREHPRRGREPAVAGEPSAPADTFRATSTPQFRFDADGNLATPRDTVTIFVGESIRWQLVNGVHTLVSGVPGQPGQGSLFNVDLNSATPTFTFTYASEGVFPFFCSLHSSTMRGAVRVLSLVGVEPLPGPADAAVGFLGPPLPNPARSFVIARFALDRPGRAWLDVVDARGRRVARLVDGDYGTGAYAVKWERRGAPAGVYFLRLDVPGATRTERVTFRD